MTGFGNSFTQNKITRILITRSGGFIGLIECNKIPKLVFDCANGNQNCFDYKDLVCHQYRYQ